jgi:hypothetical protein
MAKVQPSTEPVTNWILASLPRGDFEQMRPSLEYVPLNFGEVLHDAGQPIPHVYFPCGGLVSLLATEDGGRQAEVAVVGSEGVAGLSIFLGRTSRLTGPLSRGRGKPCGSVPTSSGARPGPTSRLPSGCFGTRTPSSSRSLSRPCATTSTRCRSACAAGCSWPRTGSVRTSCRIPSGSWQTSWRCAWRACRTPPARYSSRGSFTTTAGISASSTAKAWNGPAAAVTASSRTDSTPSGADRVRPEARQAGRLRDFRGNSSASAFPPTVLAV